MFYLSLSLFHTHKMGKHCHLLLRVQSSIWMQWHIQGFFGNDNIYSSGRETFHSEDPTLLCQGRSGPVNWLLLTNKAVKSSIVHLFLYANEVQTQHTLSFVSSLHPPSSLSLSPIGGFDVKMLWQACSLSLSAAGTKDVIGAKTRKQ